MTRASVQRRLEDLVRENRFTIAVVFPAVGAVTLVASAEGPSRRSCPTTPS